MVSQATATGRATSYGKVKEKKEEMDEFNGDALHVHVRSFGKIQEKMGY